MRGCVPNGSQGPISGGRDNGCHACDQHAKFEAIRLDLTDDVTEAVE